MRVLVACEFSGVVRDAFIERGHDAVSCDILPTEQPGPHMQRDVTEVLGDGWDMMVAFPPCTHLAVSGSRHFAAKRADGRQQNAIAFFVEMANAPIQRIAIENPVGIMSRLWRKPDQIIHPYYFGHSERKATCLWLKNLPRLVHDATDNLLSCRTHGEPERMIEYGDGRRMGEFMYRTRCLSIGKAHSASRTFTGVAAAMAEQWGKLGATAPGDGVE